MSESLKKIPTSIEAEKALLGGIFYNTEIFGEIIEIVREDDFYKKEYSEIFRAMVQIFTEGKTIDPILVNEICGKLKQFSGSAVEEALLEIADDITSSYNLIEYAEIIKEKSILRKLGNIGSKITEIAYKDDRASGDIVDEAEALVLSLSNNVSKKEIIPIKMATLDEIRRLEKVSSNKGKTVGLSTGFIDLDRMTSGLNNSDLIILAARPAMGKTAFSLNLLLNVSKIENKSVLFFSLEMSSSQLYQRLLAIEAGVPLQKIRNGFLDDDDWQKIGVATTKLANTKIFIGDLPNITVLEIRSLARKLKSRGELDLIVIDYLQLIKGTGKNGDNRQQEISDISRALKGLARELDIPIIALSQLSRAVESRLDKRPMLSDLRESGAIEQDADIVAFLYREEYYIPETENKGITELIIGKQRNGSTGTVKLNFLEAFTKFTNYTDKVK
ncbi:replicative DNA helicase [Fusobacterium sp.]|uniref:replicative DNA helicase n=2 Tax=Fusobacterium sp. TaxID=68766 RepID=UPI0025C144AA|nr:replicative DNA helicase [Fusobacterium sp.]MCI5725879.1 replicative DNA helicase [Fusobacterium sp.]MCI7224125.1 replicative DNA helicase [Fusobacterium sp.]